MNKATSILDKIRRVQSKLHGLDVVEERASDPVVIEDIKARRQKLKEELNRLQTIVKET